MERVNFDEVMDNLSTGKKAGKGRTAPAEDQGPGLFPPELRATEPLIGDEQIQNLSQKTSGPAEPAQGGNAMQRTDGQTVEGRVEEIDSRRYGVKVNGSWFKAGKDHPVSNFKSGQEVRFITRMTTRESNGRQYENWWINDLEILGGQNGNGAHSAAAQEPSAATQSKPESHNQTDLRILYGQLLNLGFAKIEGPADLSPESMVRVYSFIEREMPRVLAHRQKLLAKAERALAQAGKAAEAVQAAEAARKAAEAARAAQEAAEAFSIDANPDSDPPDNWDREDPGFSDEDIPF